jgi:hypothetical protein
MRVYIYILIDPRNEEIRYVGLTRYPKKRLHNEIHKGHTLHFRNWIQLLKKHNLRPVMEIIETADEDTASERERYWIATKRSDGCRLLNHTSGGESGWAISEETRKKLSDRMRGKKRGPMSAEHRAKISAGNRGKSKPWARDRIPYNKGKKGKPLTEQQKQHLSAIGKTRLIGEWKEKLRQGSINRKRDSKCTDEQKSQIKRLLAEGYSTRVIAEKYGVSLGTVSDVRLGRIWVKVEPSSADFPRPQYKTVAMERNKEGVCGTSANYTRGCRCDLCRKAHNVANAEWKREKRRELAETWGQPSCDSYVNMESAA